MIIRKRYHLFDVYYFSQGSFLLVTLTPKTALVEWSCMRQYCYRSDMGSCTHWPLTIWLKIGMSVKRAFTKSSVNVLFVVPIDVGNCPLAHGCVYMYQMIRRETNLVDELTLIISCKCSYLWQQSYLAVSTNHRVHKAQSPIILAFSSWPWGTKAVSLILPNVHIAFSECNAMDQTLASVIAEGDQKALFHVWLASSWTGEYIWCAHEHYK